MDMRKLRGKLDCGDGEEYLEQQHNIFIASLSAAAAALHNAAEELPFV